MASLHESGTSSSAVFRLGPATLAFFGLCAVTGIYIGVNFLSHEAHETTLRRSNAVHRHRRTRRSTIQAQPSADQERPTSLPPEIEANIEAAVTDTQESVSADDDDPESSQNIRALLYYIAEDAAKRKAYEHRGISCSECGEFPIRGVRWYCLTCADFDLCSTCEASSVHYQTHVFAKIKIPLPPVTGPPKSVRQVWYPGDPGRLHPSLSSEIRKKFAETYKLEEPRIEALYDQFVCNSNVAWPQDPNSVGVAISKRAFDEAMRSREWENRHASNVMFDRMFAFYDTNKDGLIGFEEFVDGLAYLVGPKRFASLQRVIQGFDIDGDGYIERSDVRRVLRAKFVIQQQLINQTVVSLEPEQTYNAMGVIESSQPISSTFTEDEIPTGRMRVTENKTMNGYRDLVPNEGAELLLSPTNVRGHHLRNRRATSNGGPQISAAMSQFEAALFPQSVPSAGTANGAKSEDIGNGLQTFAKGYDNMDADLRKHQAVVHETLWEVVEAALNESLDLIFKTRELHDLHLVQSRPSRVYWRRHIDAHQARDRFAKDQIQPLVSEGQDRDLFTPIEKIIDEAQYTIPSHARIAGQNKLRTASDPGPTTNVPKTVPETTIPSVVNPPKIDPPVLDMTLPQNRPDTLTVSTTIPAVLPQLISSSSGSPSSELDSAMTPPPQYVDPEDDHTTDIRIPPTSHQLEEWARQDKLEQEMITRGGRGRMSYAEVEAAVAQDSSKELRGFLKSWLEWAAF